MLKDRSTKSMRFLMNIPLFFIALPGIIYLICFSYLPMFGVVIAFKDYNYIDGILGSPWIGFENFKFFLESNDFAIVMRNTLLYNVAFLIIKTFLNILVALLLYELTNKVALKIYQTSIIVPSFISWVLVAYIGYALFATDAGIFNSILKSFGAEPINWYATPGPWPYILTFFEMWKGVGMGCIIYYAALMAIDSSLFEAASIDGAGRFRQIINISLPTIKPTICIMLILGVGSIVGGDFGLFFQMPRNSGALYAVTDVLSTYTYRGLQNGDFSQTAAVGLAQNIVALTLTLSTNAIIKKLDKNSSMF